uniref:Uncharacterized protein n=1 Tax=Myotis myotis TaxID=51298 RepID=A0A7J7TTK9_MYOMY|nr:hypothetical protein mMyoMyo1_008921 [Myotis myotis]
MPFDQQRGITGGGSPARPWPQRTPPATPPPCSLAEPAPAPSSPRAAPSSPGASRLPTLEPEPAEAAPAGEPPSLPGPGQGESQRQGNSRRPGLACQRPPSTGPPPRAPGGSSLEPAGPLLSPSPALPSGARRPTRSPATRHPGPPGGSSVVPSGTAGHRPRPAGTEPPVHGQALATRTRGRRNQDGATARTSRHPPSLSPGGRSERRVCSNRQSWSLGRDCGALRELVKRMPSAMRDTRKVPGPRPLSERRNHGREKIRALLTHLVRPHPGPWRRASLTTHHHAQRSSWRPWPERPNPPTSARPSRPIGTPCAAGTDRAACQQPRDPLSKTGLACRRQLRRPGPPGGGPLHCGRGHVCTTAAASGPEPASKSHRTERALGRARQTQLCPSVPWRGLPAPLGVGCPLRKVVAGRPSLHSPLILNGLEEGHPPVSGGQAAGGQVQPGAGAWPSCQARWKGPTAPRESPTCALSQTDCAFPPMNRGTPRAKPPGGREAEPTSGREGRRACRELRRDRPPPPPPPHKTHPLRSGRKVLRGLSEACTGRRPEAWPPRNRDSGVISTAGTSPGAGTFPILPPPRRHSGGKFQRVVPLLVPASEARCVWGPSQTSLLRLRCTDEPTPKL